jgi:hypothetical protein
MIYWTIRTLDPLNKNNQQFYSNWINNHIHDSTQILDVICETGKLVSASIIINGRLRNLDLIIDSFEQQNKNLEDIEDFIKAYDEWYELYNIPILADSEPIVLSDASIVEDKDKNLKSNFLLSRVLDLLSSFTNIKTNKMSSSVYFTENDLIR